MTIPEYNLYYFVGSLDVWETSWNIISNFLNYFQNLNHDAIAKEHVYDDIFLDIYIFKVGSDTSIDLEFHFFMFYLQKPFIALGPCIYFLKIAHANICVQRIFFNNITCMCIFYMNKLSNKVIVFDTVSDFSLL